MRIPIIPVIVLVVLMGGATLLLILSDPRGRTLGAPDAGPLLDVEGAETEVAIAPDGLRYALIASGDLWFVDLGNDDRRQLTETGEKESAPAWTEDGQRITFTRGADTLEVDPDAGVESARLQNAQDLSSTDGRIGFVRDRALWIASPDGTGARELVGADPRPEVAIRSPRFSPSGRQILFVRTWLNLHGEIWRADIETGDAFRVVGDRNTENPSAAEWIGDDTHLAYLTDRSGGITVWYVDLDASTLVPLTRPLMERSPAPLGLDVHDGRIVFPLHVSSSDISSSDGTPVISMPGHQMEPALSPDGGLIAYTTEAAGGFELWLMDRNTGRHRHLARGRAARFSPDGNQIVYAATGLDGNRDIWKTDIRSGLQEPLTAGEEIDDLPDWSPDGRTVVFSSDRGGEVALWSVPATGGRLQKLNEGGYAPRFSPDGSKLAYWHRGAIWTANADGADPVRVGDAPEPVPPVWGSAGPAFYAEGRLRAADAPDLSLKIWPEFDRLGPGSWLVSSLRVETTGLWALDLTFTED